MPTDEFRGKSGAGFYGDFVAQVDATLGKVLDALDETRAAGNTLVFQSMLRGSNEVTPIAEDYPFSEDAIFNQESYPKMHFVESLYAGDPTNWWIPNHACIEAVLRSAGFHVTARPGHEIYVCKPGKTKSSEWDRREFLSAVGRRA